jgi:hypothetical protein
LIINELRKQENYIAPKSKMAAQGGNIGGLLAITRASTGRDNARREKCKTAKSKMFRTFARQNQPTMTSIRRCCPRLSIGDNSLIINNLQ